MQVIFLAHGTTPEEGGRLRRLRRSLQHVRHATYAGCASGRHVLDLLVNNHPSLTITDPLHFGGAGHTCCGLPDLDTLLKRLPNGSISTHRLFKLDPRAAHALAFKYASEIRRWLTQHRPKRGLIVMGEIPLLLAMSAFSEHVPQDPLPTGKLIICKWTATNRTITYPTGTRLIYQP